MNEKKKKIQGEAHGQNGLFGCHLFLNDVGRQSDKPYDKNRIGKIKHKTIKQGEYNSAVFRKRWQAKKNIISICRKIL